MSQDPPPNVPISDPTHPQEVKAVAVDLGVFRACTNPTYDDAHFSLTGGLANPIEALDVICRDAAGVPLRAGGRYRLLLIIEQDGP